MTLLSFFNDVVVVILVVVLTISKFEFVLIVVDVSNEIQTVRFKSVPLCALHLTKRMPWFGISILSKNFRSNWLFFETFHDWICESSCVASLLDVATNSCWRGLHSSSSALMKKSKSQFILATVSFALWKKALSFNIHFSYV